MAVVFYHVDFLGFESGFIGVDIFFVVSGYLILGKIVRDLANNEFKLFNFWERRIRRLLPAAFTVVLITLLVTPLFLTQPDFVAAQRDAIFSSLNIVNWHFAIQNTNYWDINQVSPFLHFWSLSVEEQFYVFAPLALLGFWIGLKRLSQSNLQAFKIGLLGTSAVSFLLMTVPSWSTSTLYFNSVTRIWEFTLGGVAALITNRLNKRLGNSIKLLAMFALVGTTLLPQSGNYPGTLTLIPVSLTCIFLIVDDFNAPRFQIAQLIQRFAIRIGDYSYSIYLWHWPITVFAFSFTYGADFAVGQTSIRAKLFVIATSLIAGWASYKFIETPTKKLSWNRKGLEKWLAVSVASFLVVLGAQSAIATTTAGRFLPTPAELTNSATDSSSATFITNPDFTDIFSGVPTAVMQPATSSAELDAQIKQLLKNRAEIYRNGCHLEGEAFLYSSACEFGDSAGTKTVMLVGDSHAANWFPALNTASKISGFKMLSRTKSSCGLLDLQLSVGDGTANQSCLEWRDSIFSEIQQRQPDLLIVAQIAPLNQDLYLNSQNRQNQNQQYRASVVQELGRLIGVTDQVLFVDDIPRLTFEPSKCLKTFAPDSCLSNRQEFEVPPTHLYKESVSNLKSVNFNDLICSVQKCSATNPSGIVFRDSHHLTEAFSRSLAPVWAHILRTY